MILDVGSGHQIRDPSKGRDIARGDVNIDIEKPARIPKNFVRADAHNLPFIDTFFEKVYFYDVIEHVENPSQCLREIRRVLKPNGTVEISTPNPLHWRTFLRVWRGQKIELGGREHISTWTHIEMEILMEKAEFRDVKICYTILATEKYYSKRHILLGEVAYKFLPSGISGRNMIVNALK